MWLFDTTPTLRFSSFAVRDTDKLNDIHLGIGTREPGVAKYVHEIHADFAKWLADLNICERTFFLPRSDNGRSPLCGRYGVNSSTDERCLKTALAEALGAEQLDSNVRMDWIFARQCVAHTLAKEVDSAIETIATADMDIVSSGIPDWRSCSPHSVYIRHRGLRIRIGLSRDLQTTTQNSWA